MFNCVISSSMTLSAFLICLLSALVMGILAALVFNFRNKHSSSIPVAYVLLPPAVTLIIMMVNGNIGAGLGVAGAFSLFRFRSAPATARELVGLFVCSTVGLACGMGYVGIAAVFFLIVSAAMLVMSLLNFGENSRHYRQLRITIPENLDYDGLFDDLFEEYTTRHDLVKVRTTNMGTLYELTYSIYLKDNEVSKQFIDAIRCRNGNLNIVCGRESDKDTL